MSSSGAQGPQRLYRGNGGFRLSRRESRMAARGHARCDSATGQRGRSYQKLTCRGTGALRPRHTSYPLRRGRLERFAPARRSQHAGLDGEQLDGRVIVRATQSLPEVLRRAGRDDDVEG